MYQQIAANKRRSIILVVAFVGVVVALGYVVSTFSTLGDPIVVVAVVVATAMALTSWWAGDRIALLTAGAVPIDRTDDPALYRLVENLTIAAGLPMPKVHLIPDSAMNAFATGRDPAHASIAVTQGLRERLTDAELEGVIAHELSHVGNYDTRFLMLTIVLVGTVGLLADLFLRSQFFGGRRRGEGEGGNGLLLIVGLVFALLAPLVAKLMQLAISRRREFLADASGVMLTRYPTGLIGALKKIATANEPLVHGNQAIAPLYFANPFGGVRERWSNFFSTHPPIAERIRALEAMGT